MMPMETWKNWNDCIIFFYKKNLEISFQNGSEHETTSLRALEKSEKKIRDAKEKQRLDRGIE